MYGSLHIQVQEHALARMRRRVTVCVGVCLSVCLSGITLASTSFVSAV